MRRLASNNDDKKRERSLSMSLSSSSYVSPQRRQPKKKPMLEKVLDIPWNDIEKDEYPETPEYFRQQRKRTPPIPRVSPLNIKTTQTIKPPLVEQQSYLQSRVHTLTQALVKANQHHKRTQEHLTWALEENAALLYEKQQYQLQYNQEDQDGNNDHPMTDSIDGGFNFDEENRIEQLASQANHLRQENIALRDLFASNMAEMKSSFQFLTETIQKQQRKQNDALNAQYYENEMAILEAKCMTLMHDRKVLHNTIQELRGNIRVYCRLRPQSTDKSVVYVDSDTRLTIKDGQEAVFLVDKVFTEHNTQHDVFIEVEPLIVSALDGYNVCILAYGQTGSGKTHTMMGSLRSEINRGLVGRVFDHVFQRIKVKDNQIETQVQISVLEIYNEKVIDLVQLSPIPLEVRVDKKNGVSVPNRTWIAVSNVAECMVVMEKALRHRSVAANDLNDASSRSHCITTLKFRRLNGVLMESKINLVDLAGSERLGTSNSIGERRSEAQHINKSLMALRHVLLQLKNKQNYISYRDSKLTMLLQDAIGGNAKTILFVCINPSIRCANESKCSLAFGERTNLVELGKSKQNILHK